MNGLDAYDNPVMHASTIANDERPLMCGHSPSKHEMFTTGTAHMRDGREICYACADDEQRASLKTEEHIGAYLSGDGKRITTWSGGMLMRVTYEITHKTGFHRSALTYLRAEDENGRRWYGCNAGRSMYVTMRAMKDRKRHA